MCDQWSEQVCAEVELGSDIIKSLAKEIQVNQFINQHFVTRIIPPSSPARSYSYVLLFFLLPFPNAISTLTLLHHGTQKETLLVCLLQGNSTSRICMEKPVWGQWAGELESSSAQSSAWQSSNGAVGETEF
jgi:hypothetical protein